MAEGAARARWSGTALPLYEGKCGAAGAANRCGGGQQGDCARDKRHGGAAWRHAGRRRDNDGLRRCARRGSRGAGCAVGRRRFVDSHSGGFCGAGLRAGKGSGGAANGQAAAAQRDAAGCAVFCREGVGAQPYHLCVGEKRDCRCGQKRRWRELARGDGGAVRQFFVGLRAGRRRRGFRRKPRAV